MKIISFDSDRPELIGQEIEFVRMCRTEDGFDEEVLPMMFVKVKSTGEQLAVWPDEVE